MDLRQLEYFCAAADAGSFSAAAKAVYVAQQTLSASVASLEQGWGLPLFHRRRSGIELTEFGEAVLPRCRTLIEEAHSVQAFAETYKEAAAQTVTFAYATASLQQEGGHLSLSGVAQFREEHPEVDMRIFELTSDACLAAITEGEVDLAFVVGHPDPSRYEFAKLVDAHLLVALPEDHPLTEKEALSFRDMDGIPIFPTPDLKDTYRYIVAGFEHYGLRPNYVPLPFSLENAQRFVRAGEGIDFSPEHNADFPHEGIVYRPLVEEDAFALPLGLAECKGKGLSPAAALLKEFLLELPAKSKNDGLM